MEDEYGNSLVRINDTIYLTLASESRKRNLGSLNESARSIIMFRDFRKHLHLKSNSFGFNYTLLKTATKFDTVHLKTNQGDILNIPVKFILDNGKFLFFKQQGFEKQIFVSLSLLSNFKTN